MRVIQNTQMHIGEVDISQVALDLESRDDIPQILRGLDRCPDHGIAGFKRYAANREK